MYAFISNANNMRNQTPPDRQHLFQQPIISSIRPANKSANMEKHLLFVAAAS
ncbi:hypothetical protein XENORESO_022078, partial [Xenotaenia resolanae]